MANADANADAKAKYNIAELLQIANTQTATRTADTAKLYTDGKINFAVGSGVEDGKRYTAKIANQTLLLYADKDGKRKAHAKGTDGVIVGITAKLAKMDDYQTAVEHGKIGDTCDDYTVEHQTADGIDYIIIDLAEHLAE